jgi:hypothetical protein
MKCLVSDIWMSLNLCWSVVLENTAEITCFLKSLPSMHFSIKSVVSFVSHIVSLNLKIDDEERHSWNSSAHMNKTSTKQKDYPKKWGSLKKSFWLGILNCKWRWIFEWWYNTRKGRGPHRPPLNQHFTWNAICCDIPIHICYESLRSRQHDSVSMTYFFWDFSHFVRSCQLLSQL